MKGFLFDFELEGGVNNSAMFTIAFNSSPFSPAKTQGDPDDCYPAEGGEIEDLSIFIKEEVRERGFVLPVPREIPEYLWPALGFDRDRLVEMCEEHVKDEQERQEADEGDRKRDEAKERRGVEGD
jgi:hypothetical protein